MAVTPVGPLVVFTTSGTNAIADLNTNLALIRNQFNTLVTASNTLITGLTIPAPIITGVITGGIAVTGASTITGTLSGVTTFTATTGTFTNLTVPTPAQPNITSLSNIVTLPSIAGQNSDLILDSPANFAAQVRMRTAGAEKWTVGRGSQSGSADYEVYNSVLGATALKISSATSLVTVVAGLAFTGNSAAVAGTIAKQGTDGLAIWGVTGVSYDMAFYNNAGAYVARIPTATTTFNLAGNLSFSTAVSQIVPGATSLSFRNNVSNADNFIISDAGNATLRGNLTFASATTKIAVPAGGGTDFRLAADAGSVLLIQDTGTVQVSNGQFSLAASTASRPSLLMPSGTAPTVPTDGMMWYNGTNLFFRNGGTTRTITWV